jgi:hypothetical protein
LASSTKDLMAAIMSRWFTFVASVTWWKPHWCSSLLAKAMAFLAVKLTGACLKYFKSTVPTCPSDNVAHPLLWSPVGRLHLYAALPITSARRGRPKSLTAEVR